jgi:hypothetical protein
MDAFLPGVAGWEAVYNNPVIWHFRFNGPTPEALVQGRERSYFEHFWNDFAADKTHSIPEPDRRAVRGSLLQAGTHGRRVGLLRFLPAGRRGFRPALSNQAHHAGPVDRGREGEPGRAGTSNEAGRLRRDFRRAEGCRALGDGRTAAGDDGRPLKPSTGIGQGVLESRQQESSATHRQCYECTRPLVSIVRSGSYSRQMKNQHPQQEHDSQPRCG